jgi:flagellum-specific peptidoglycan hydrolase FlgJ
MHAKQHTPKGTAKERAKQSVSNVKLKFPDKAVQPVAACPSQKLQVEASLQSAALQETYPGSVLQPAGLGVPPVPRPGGTSQNQPARVSDGKPPQAAQQPTPAPPSKFPAGVIAGAQAVQSKYGVPASVTLAQWALESNYGKSTPPGSNNPFGIKAKPGEPYVMAWTPEYVNGQKVQVQAAFRKFDSYAQAFDARGQLLSQAPRYAKAMEQRDNPDRFVEELQNAGYATDPQYANKLKAIMQSNNLYQYNNR